MSNMNIKNSRNVNTETIEDKPKDLVDDIGEYLTEKGNFNTEEWLLDFKKRVGIADTEKTYPWSTKLGP